MTSEIKNSLPYFPYNLEKIDNIVNWSFKNRISSLGVSTNVNRNVTHLFDFLNKYPHGNLLLQPYYGLKYYDHIEQIAFDIGRICEVLSEEIKALRIDLPNSIVHKCICMLNSKFDIHMHSINFLVVTNNTYMHYAWWIWRWFRNHANWKSCLHIHIRTRKIKVYHCSEIDRQKITDIIQIVHYKTTRKSILLNWMFHNGAPSSILEFGVLFGRSTFSIKSIRYKSWNSNEIYSKMI